MAAFRRIITYLRDREMMAMLDCDSVKMMGFLVPCTHTDSTEFWYHAPVDTFTVQSNVLAARFAAEREAEAEAKAKAARIAAEAEA